MEFLNSTLNILYSTMCVVSFIVAAISSSPPSFNISPTIVFHSVFLIIMWREG